MRRLTSLRSTDRPSASDGQQTARFAELAAAPAGMDPFVAVTRDTDHDN